MLRSLAAVLASVTLAFASSSAQSPGSPWPPSADHKTIPLWPEHAPGATTTKGPEADTTTDKDRQVAGRRVIRIGNVSSPTLTVYSAHAAHTSGPAVIVFPGGGYRILAIDLEGTEVCDWLISIEVNCVLVKYRVPDTGPYPKSGRSPSGCAARNRNRPPARGRVAH